MSDATREIPKLTDLRPPGKFAMTFCSYVAFHHARVARFMLDMNRQETRSTLRDFPSCADIASDL
jgi:hypothetical protein